MDYFLERVYRRFCEIQEIPTKKNQMEYHDLKNIVAKYGDLCKCPELKVSLTLENLFQLKNAKEYSKSKFFKNPDRKILTCSPTKIS